MSDTPSITRTQSAFLRAFHLNPTGPTPDDWPSPAILRRWLRKPNFRRALLSLLQTLRFQADFTLAAAASTASQSLASPSEESGRHTTRLAALLRLSHLQRFGKARNRHSSDDDDEELPDLEDPEDAEDPERARELAQQAIKILPPYDRLTTDEFHDLAVKDYDYVPNVYTFDVFPPPPPEGSPYHQILANPGTLICFLKRFNETDPHKRYARLIKRCKGYLWHDADIPPIANSPASQGK